MGPGFFSPQSGHCTPIGHVFLTVFFFTLSKILASVRKKKQVCPMHCTWVVCSYSLSGKWKWHILCYRNEWHAYVLHLNCISNPACRIQNLWPKFSFMIGNFAYPSETNPSETLNIQLDLWIAVMHSNLEWVTAFQWCRVKSKHGICTVAILLWHISLHEVQHPTWSQISHYRAEHIIWNTHVLIPSWTIFCFTTSVGFTQAHPS